MSVPALVSVIEPPSYVTLYPLSPAKTVSGTATQRITARNLFILSPDFFRESLTNGPGSDGATNQRSEKVLYDCANVTKRTASRPIMEWPERDVASTQVPSERR